MEDRHAKELSSALESVASAVKTLGWLVFMGLMYVGCSMTMHH